MVVIPRPLARAMGAGLIALGANGVQEDVPPGVTPHFRQPWETGPAPRPSRRVLLRAWFADRPADTAIATILAGAEPEWGFQPEEDWNEGWKAAFQPVRISDRLVVAAPWHAVPDALVIEPGNAFGTGEHVTTRACLRAIDRHAVAGKRLLDVGCGSGILALAGAKLGMEATGIDVDPDAVGAAQEAARRNGLAARFSTTALAEVEERFDLVVANLFAEVLVALAPDLDRVAAGPIVCAGILADRASLVRNAFHRPLLLDESEGDWVSLVFA